MLNAARNDKQVLIGHRLFIVDDKKKNQLDKTMNCAMVAKINLSRGERYLNQFSCLQQRESPTRTRVAEGRWGRKQRPRRPGQLYRP